MTYKNHKMDKTVDPDSFEMLDPDPYPDQNINLSGSTTLNFDVRESTDTVQYCGECYCCCVDSSLLSGGYRLPNFCAQQLD